MQSKRVINEKSFGGKLYALRKTALISFDDFRTALGVTKTYLNDVETGFVRPPTPAMQISMLRILSVKAPVSQSDSREFFDLAATARHELPADVFLFLKTNPSAVAALRDGDDYRQFYEKQF